MKQYKKWTPAQRIKSYRWTMKAIKDGIITDRSKKVCNKCTQSEGIIMLHNEDYDVTLSVLGDYYEKNIPVTQEKKEAMSSVLEEMCWRCHLIYHSKYRSPAECEQYWKEIKEGKIYPPVYKSDLRILRRDHGIK